MATRFTNSIAPAVYTGDRGKDDVEPVVSLLKKYSASITKNRIIILSIFFQYPAGIGVSQLRAVSPVHLDRISVYRTIRFFLRKQIIAVIPAATARPLYILSKYLPRQVDNAKADQFIYFICHCCGQTEIKKLIAPVAYRCPPHYQVTHTYVVMEGVCGPCKTGNRTGADR